MRLLRAWALFALAGLLACAPPEAPRVDPDPALLGLALIEVGPRVVVPGSQIVLVGQSFPSPGDGTIAVLLSGDVRVPGSAPRRVDVRLRADYVSPTEARVPAAAELFSALGLTEGQIEGNATLVVDSAVDLRSHVASPVRVQLRLQQALRPELYGIEYFGAQRVTGELHPNDWIGVRGDGLLLGGAEGQTVAVLSGCFLPDGASEPCAESGQPVVRAEVPVRPRDPRERASGVFAYAPTIHGIRPGRFQGTLTLENRPPGGTVQVSGNAIPLSVALVRPELAAFSPAAASLGQYVELRGAGFVSGAPGQATVARLVGEFSLEGSPLRIPVDLEIVVQYLPRFPDGPVGRYVLDETDALGQALAPRGGLRGAAGTFTGTATVTLRYGKDSVASKPTPVTLSLLRPKQVVRVRFLPAYQSSLRLFGLRAVDNAVRARVLDVARRDYAGVNIEFREARDDEPADAPLPDFAQFAEVEIGGSDPNGLGYLGYDNTPGRDSGNARLYDRIGGVNAVTQSDGSPGYGGVFSEQLLGFSAHPGRVEKIKVPAADSDLFDRVFDPMRPDEGGARATPAEAAQVPALSSGGLCPAAPGDRPRQVACAIFVLGSLIGTTMTHELGHSLGLANPNTPSGSYHNNGTQTGRIMNSGTLRSFTERAELSPAGPAVFCSSDYDYLRRILPAGAAPPAIARPPCLD